MHLRPHEARDRVSHRCLLFHPEDQRLPKQLYQTWHRREMELLPVRRTRKQEPSPLALSLSCNRWMNVTVKQPEIYLVPLEVMTQIGCFSASPQYGCLSIPRGQGNLDNAVTTRVLCPNSICTVNWFYFHFLPEVFSVLYISHIQSE